MLNFLFCDDNSEFLSLLRNYVEKSINDNYATNYKTTAFFSFEKGRDVIDFAENNRVDVIFLDIDMKDVTGFAVAKRLLEINDDVKIVFVSAYDHFVYDSFEYYPLAFLRKSKVCDELPRILRRLFDILNKPNEVNIVNSNSGTLTVRNKDIVFINSAGNYCYYVMKDGKQYSCRETLNNIEKSLTGRSCFFRVHAAYIVNMENIQMKDKAISVIVGEETVLIPIAQRRFWSFKKAYSDYLSRRVI